MAKGSDRYYSTKELAELFGVSERRIQQLTKEGIISRLKAGTYHADTVISQYIKFLSDKAYNREQTPDEATLKKQILEADKKLKAIKLQKQELELEEIRGTLHRAEDVSAVMSDTMMQMRGMLLALPGQLAIDVFQADSSAEAAEIIKGSVHQILERLANYQYDPDAYRERVAARRGYEHEFEED